IALKPSGIANAVQYQPVASSAGQRRHAGAANHAAKLSEISEPAGEFVFTFGSAGPMADDAAEGNAKCRLGGKSGGQDCAGIQQRSVIPANSFRGGKYDLQHR